MAASNGNPELTLTVNGKFLLKISCKHRKTKADRASVMVTGIQLTFLHNSVKVSELKYVSFA